MKIQLYYNKSEPRTIDKLLDLRGGELEGEFRDAVDIQTPSIRINGNAITKNCNYLYIKELDRYYYITSIVSERNNTTILNCKLDVLYTYKTSLLNCYGLINRAEKSNSHNRYVFDNDFVTETPYAHISQKFDMTDAGELGIRTVLMTICGATPVSE